MLYIIGVDHKIQYKFWLQKCQYSQFEAYLGKQVAKYGVALIAEELSEEAMQPCGVKESLGQMVAQELGVEHRFCDPTSEERESLGIPSEAELKQHLGLGKFLKDTEPQRLEEEEQKYWPIRERFWLDRICDATVQPVLFLCGDTHVDSFLRLLESEGHDAKVLSRHWGTNRSEA